MAAQAEPLMFHPDRIYVLDAVWRNPDAAGRAERAAAALPGARVETITYDDVPDLVVQHGWDHFPRMGTMDCPPDPIPLLGVHQFDADAARRTADRMAGLYKGDRHFPWYEVAGARPFYFSHFTGKDGQCAKLEDLRPDPQWVCRPQWRLRQGRGCPHQCAYCGLGGVLITHVNVADYIEHLARLLAENPWQKTWLYDDAMDVPTFEPQLGTLGELMRFFQTTDDRYLIVHTKTDRVQAFLEPNAPDNTIIAWSLSGPTQSRELEPKSGTTEGRIAAARQCQEAGITVRFKFKPIVPIPTWREEADETVAQVFAETRPDNLSMTVLMWMDCEALLACIGEDRLDPTFVQAAREAVPASSEGRNGPFPIDKREEVYRHYLAAIRRHDTEVPVCISTESLDLWKQMGPDLGFSPTDYVCGCGAGATPGLRRLARSPWQDARAARQWDGTPAVVQTECV